MYEGIFNDVREVEKNLKEAGIEEINETKIFNLLENLKCSKVVTQILVESKELNDPEANRYISGPSKFLAFSDFVNDHNESEVEVIKEVRKEDKVKTVDLTDTPDDLVLAKVEKEEPQGAEASRFGSAAENSNEDSNADSSMNQNDCSNDSDVENYYTTSDYEEVDVNKKETDKAKTESPPPILSILKDLCENPKIPEQSVQPAFEEIREIENFEILEENNNDPNNNNDLEEVQLVEQPRPRSPVAGCSRDFVERELRRPISPMILSVDGEDFSTSHPKSRCSSKNCYTRESMEPQPSCSKEFTKVEENGNEIEEFDSRKSSQTNYEKLLEETEAINRLFPDLSGDMIFSMLDKYKKATNRVTIVLWDLLPRERPEPNIPKKRKRVNDPCPSKSKKALPSLSSSKIDYNTIKKIQKEVRNVERRDSSEIDTSYSSAEEFALDQGFLGVNNSEVKNQHKESPKGKGKSLLRSCVIQPPKFNFQPTSVPESEPKPVQKNVILAAPKLIINTPGKEPENILGNFQELIPKPAKSKVTMPTRELTDEGFIAEGFESVNTTPNISTWPKSPTVAQESKKVKLEQSKPPMIEFFQSPLDVQFSKVQYKVEQSKSDALQIKIKKLRNFEVPVIKVRSDLISSGTINTRVPAPIPIPALAPPYNSELPAPGFQKYDAASRVSPVVNDKNNRELENLLNRYLPNEQLEPAPALDFLKPNRENQFYQMPKIIPLPYNVPQPQLNHSNGPMPSTSWANLLKIPDSRQPTIIAGPSIANPVIKKTLENSEIPCKDTYYKLRSIFPDIDPAFIKKKCINPPFSTNGLSKEQQLNMLVEILLTDGSNHHQIQEIKEESVDVGNKDEQYENLLGIFPDADPTYLRDFVDKNYNNPDSLKDFVQRNLENPSYPTRDQYLKKVRITEQIKEYTTDFDIKKFLQIFPDPVAHFENSSRTSEYNAMVYEFLKDVFCKHKNECFFLDQETQRVVTISQIYRRRKYHLSLTASDLRRILPDMKNKRHCFLIPTENIPLLQEMAYVRHKNEIVAYLEEMKMNEEKELSDLRAKGMLLECQCCFSDECMPRKCSSCEKGHLFCHACILRGTESKMGDGQNHIFCFASCDSEFSLSVLQEVLPPTTFSILLQKRQEAEVMAAGLEGLVSCPFCHFASIPPTESKVFKCLNPDCMKETCRLCKELNHVPLRCDEVMKADQARLHLEEKMTEALVRTCYQCQKSFFKEEGCNKMTCVCGASMCYLCSAPLKNGDYSHFNGQGATSIKLCPLWSDNRRMNAKVVRKVAEVTENEIRKKNPNLKINAKAILPTLPPKTRGPHDDIPNANALPEYIRRVANINP